MSRIRFIRARIALMKGQPLKAARILKIDYANMTNDYLMNQIYNKILLDPKGI